MDIVLDLWIHAIYNDEQVQGSDIGPVVYFRNCTGNPLVNYAELALRWGISKSTVSRILNKLQDKEYLSLVSFTGRHGSVIYLCNYLSTMLYPLSDCGDGKYRYSLQLGCPDKDIRYHFELTLLPLEAEETIPSHTDQERK